MIRVPSPRPSRPAVVLVAALLSVVVPAASAAAAPTWTRPVPGALVRPFRAPSTPYGSGHRGIDLLAAAGEPVRAPAAGVVELAGPVAGSVHVVLRLADGTRASVSFLESAAVAVGDRVAAGTTLGRAGGAGPGHPSGAVHLAWRVGGAYRDPTRRLPPRSYRLGTPTGRAPGGLG